MCYLRKLREAYWQVHVLPFTKRWWSEKRTGVMQESTAGVSLSDLDEVTVMTVWPSIAANPLGRILGRLYAIRFPDIYIFRLGNLIALMFIPVSLVLFFHRLGPLVATRYRVTNHRLIVERGLRNVEESSVSLDQFNEVLVDVRAGQSWYFAGDLIFKKGETEVFRLEGVSRPEAFRHVCLKAQVAYSGVEAVLAQAAG
ncbi:MAG: PH domain-containing protein [Pirellulaceae bacterium]